MKVSMAAPLEIDLGVLGWSDSLILMVLALVVFGPRRLPQIGRQIGKLMYEFRKASNDFKFQMEEELRAAEEADRRKKEEERLRALAAQNSPPAPAPTPVVSSGSPYGEDAVYPPSALPAETPSSEPAEPQSEAAGPSIQPPSTGEPVAAARPFQAAEESANDPERAGRNGAGALAESDLRAAGESGAGSESAASRVEEGQQVTEQAARHG